MGTETVTCYELVSLLPFREINKRTYDIIIILLVELPFDSFMFALDLDEDPWHPLPPPGFCLAFSNPFPSFSLSHQLVVLEGVEDVRELHGLFRGLLLAFVVFTPFPLLIRSLMPFALAKDVKRQRLRERYPVPIQRGAIRGW